MLSLNNKQILLGVTGGIAAYKSAELCRLLVKAGARVRVVMTEAGTEFVTPLTMAALSGNRVHTGLLDEEAEAAMGHIELARWADLIAVAPASANFIARLRQGEAGDLLSTLCLATRAPIVIAPAMNQAMWANPRTQANLEGLAGGQVHIFGPDSGSQACGETGPGRMLEPAVIAERMAELFETGSLAGVPVTITAGPTREAIDPVRYISNHSSGKMGYALAQAAVTAGAQVRLISGPVSLPSPERLDLVRVNSAGEMLEAVLQRPGKIFISVAAVADYRPQTVAGRKIKKSGQEEMQITLVRNPDILATVAGLPDRPYCVGFAAETDHMEDYARAKLRGKNLDLVFANHATDTFNSDCAAVTAYWHEGEKEFPLAPKTRLAREMIELISSFRGA